MISVEEALQRILSQIDCLEPEEKPILECLGQVLAADVHSTLDVPPLDNSAMDGFAVRSDDTSAATDEAPLVLPVLEEVAAGRTPTREVAPCTAIRIMTGAPMPVGADAVVPFEDTDELTRSRPGGLLSHIGIHRQARPGANVRRRGEDLMRGDFVLRKGRLLRPAEIGVLASIGVSRVSVTRRPVVSIVSTGDELRTVEEPLRPGQIHDANTYTLAALVLQYGGVPKIVGIGRDSLESLSQCLNEASVGDLLITSGGVSRGDYDVVKRILAQRGELLLWTVRMKPGKPLAFGMLRSGDRKRTIPHLGLPGNPVSAMVTFEQFARPAILKMLGHATWGKPTIVATIENDIANKDGRCVFARVVVRRQGEEYRARTTGPQGSGMLTSMALANGLAIVPEGSAGVKAGERIQVQMLDWREDRMNAQGEDGR